VLLREVTPFVEKVLLTEAFLTMLLTKICFPS